jgi:hypothetical protein
MTMPTYYAFEGVGTELNFQTSKVRFAIESFSLPEASRDSIETTHLKSTAKTFMPATLIDYGEVSIQFQNDPTLIPRMINRAAPRLTLRLIVEDVEQRHQITSAAGAAAYSTLMLKCTNLIGLSEPWRVKPCGKPW